MGSLWEVRTLPPSFTSYKRILQTLIILIVLILPGLTFWGQRYDVVDQQLPLLRLSFAIKELTRSRSHGIAPAVGASHPRF